VFKKKMEKREIEEKGLETSKLKKFACSMSEMLAN